MSFNYTTFLLGILLCCSGGNSSGSGGSGSDGSSSCSGSVRAGCQDTYMVSCGCLAALGKCHNATRDTLLENARNSWEIVEKHPGRDRY